MHKRAHSLLSEDFSSLIFPWVFLVFCWVVFLRLQTELRTVAVNQRDES